VKYENKKGGKKFAEKVVKYVKGGEIEQGEWYKVDESDYNQNAGLEITI